MPRPITTATHHDIERVGAIMAEGFSDDPVMLWVFGDEAPAARARALAVMFTFIAGEVVVDFGATHLLDDACAMWTPPDPPEWPPDRGERFMSELGAVVSEASMQRLGQLEALMQEHHPGQAHWYLGAIACVPAARGQGLGGALLDHALGVIDDAGLPTYLESSNPRNVTLYARKGFETTSVVHLPDGPPLTMMWRPAR